MFRQIEKSNDDEVQQFYGNSTNRTFMIFIAPQDHEVIPI